MSHDPSVPVCTVMVRTIPQAGEFHYCKAPVNDWLCRSLHGAGAAFSAVIGDTVGSAGITPA